MLASVLKLGSRRAMGFSPRLAARGFGSFNKDPAQQVGIFLILLIISDVAHSV